MKTKTNKLIKMATMVAAVGAMLSFAGCGQTPEKEYESLIRATMKGAPAAVVDAQVKEALAEFKKMSAEEQKIELEKSKAFFEGIKGGK